MGSVFRVADQLFGDRKIALPAMMMEPMTGIEPAYSAWEADVLPLNYIGVRGLLSNDSLANRGPDDGDRPRCRGYPRDQALAGAGTTRRLRLIAATDTRRRGDHTWSTATAQR